MTNIAAAVLLISTSYVVLIAASPTLAEELSGSVGAPGSSATITLVGVSASILGLGYTRIRNSDLRNTAFVVTVGLATLTTLLGIASYWQCSGEQSEVFTPIARTLALFVGSVEEPFSIGTDRCNTFPISLEIARITALLTTFVGIGALALSVIRNQWDRILLRIPILTPSPTVVIGVDDEVMPLIRAIQDTGIGRPLAIITSDASRDGLNVMRRRGARIVETDLTRDEILRSLNFWGKVDRLYLLSEDPSRNAQRLKIIDREIIQYENKHGADKSKIRRQLTCRIDDPLLAEYWRHNPIRNSTNTHWIVDTVGTYDVTASRLADALDNYAEIDHIYFCGGTPLFLSLVEQLTRRSLEYSFMPTEGQRPIRKVTLVAADATELVADSWLRQRKRGVRGHPVTVIGLDGEPTINAMTQLLADAADHSRIAVIVAESSVGDGSPTGAEHFANRLAARYPNVVIFGLSVGVDGVSEGDLLGNVRLFGLSLALPEGTAHDSWERAARVIHERYARQVKATSPERESDPMLRDWDSLDKFVQGSNRRLVENILWMVERHTNHRWFCTQDVHPSSELTEDSLSMLPALQALEALGFTEDDGRLLAEKEHEDWCRYYTKNGWERADAKDVHARKHDRLVEWPDLDDEQREDALRSIVFTLLQLRALGYHSRPQSSSDPLGASL
ncbi:RyR domain-containing protein [Rhodococcus rhodochrous]|uniref:RyR domain-containing protein n=1 Tax=Rhodococcus rhodochrous TaxID=1829 RepID=UPI0012FD7E39|nr:RyR domain-containing protein [Rhodococcus rhodochrous]